MERTISRRKAESLPEILLRLRTKFSKSKPPTDPSELLAVISGEIAKFADDAEQNTVSDHHKQLPGCGITWPPLVCAPESDDVASMTNAESSYPPASSHAVDELLPVLKSELQRRDVLGRSHEESRLLSRLMLEEASQFSVIPIIGTGGIGKTTLARVVYENDAVQKHFEVRAWVKVAGEDLRQLEDVARKLIKAATGMSCPLTSLDDLDEMVIDSFVSQRSLIVLDEIESINVNLWRHMEASWFSVVGLGSKVIITSCNEQVANTVDGEPFELKALSQDASWSLYSSLAFDYSKVIEDTGLIPTARRLAARCKGVPLSLKLLGSLMRFEESLIEILSSGGLMERIASSMHVWMVLSLSVLALPQDLLNCFAYCSFFPCGFVLEKEKLIKMWVAEGLVTETKTAPEDTADAYFHQLLCRCFFTDIICNDYGDIVHVRMPAMIHKFAQMIATTTHRDKVAYVVAGGVDQQQDCFSLASPYGKIIDPRNLLTLISPSIRISSMKANQSILEFKRLRSLDLSSTGIRELSHHISALKKLKYLSLSHTLIAKLPKSLTRLVRLQTIDLSGCYYLRELPQKITNLSRLRHLDLSECNSMSHLPSGISYLNSLQTMPLFVLGQPDKSVATLGELHKLNKLRGVLLIRNLENVKDAGQAQAADLKHKKLHHLGLSWSYNVDECHEVLEFLQPNPQLRVLDLTGYGAYGFPSWMPKLHALVKLSIKDCRCHRLPTLGKLPFLKKLHLEGLLNIRLIGPEFYGTALFDVFPSLEKLKLYDLQKLCKWSSASSRAFPRLKTLSIKGCPQLHSLPLLPSVTELVVRSSNRKILPLLTRITSLSSLLINDMDVGELDSLSLLKKLVLVHCTDSDALTSYLLEEFIALEHLSILHCLKLKIVALPRLQSLRKLNIIDCQDLRYIELVIENSTLTELVIEDCCELVSIEDTASFGASLRKLIVRNCPLSRILIGELQALEFLFISGCPRLEARLKEEKWQISHVPCVILGDRQSAKTS